jgi:hypothetical protein
MDLSFLLSGSFLQQLIRLKKFYIVEADLEEDNEVSVQTTENTRFTISSDGVITDSKTGLEWLICPDSGPSWNQAKAWVKDVQTYQSLCLIKNHQKGRTGGVKLGF